MTPNDLSKLRNALSRWKATDDHSIGHDLGTKAIETYSRMLDEIELLQADPAKSLAEMWLQMSASERNDLMALCCRHCGEMQTDTGIGYPRCTCMMDD